MPGAWHSHSERSVQSSEQVGSVSSGPRAGCRGPCLDRFRGAGVLQERRLTNIQYRAGHLLQPLGKLVGLEDVIGGAAAPGV